MARMTKCSRCGADNSVRRTTCYACAAPLTPAGEPAAAVASTSSQRFAVVLEEQARRPREPRAAAAETGAPPAGGSAAASSLPNFYATAGQVRRAMMLFRQLHALVQAGIPLGRALVDLQKRPPRGLEPALRHLAQHVADGGKLSDAMRSYPNLFLDYHVALISAGELAGGLPQALDQIASDCELEFKVRRAIAVAMMPVSLVTLVMLLVLPVALTLREPPPGDYWTLTSLAARYIAKMLTVSLPITLGLGGLWIFSAAASRRPALAAAQHRISLSLPIVGAAHRRSAMMRFLGSLSLLLNAGVPVADAYRSAASAAGNKALTSHLMREADHLYAGRGLADLLARLRVLSAQSMDRMAVGEVTGKLPEVLGQLAADYRRQVERSARYLPYLLQFAAYAVIGPLAGLLYFSLVRIYLDYRFNLPLDHLFDVP